jgi:hypothetical protein
MRKVTAMTLGVLLLGGGAAWAQTGAAGAAAGPFSASAEALIWWFKSSPTPVPIITNGLVGEPDTKTLLGGGSADTNPNPGFRLTAGYALNERWGLEGNFLYIPARSTSSSVSSSGEAGSTDLLLPFMDATRDNRETATEISFAPIYRGSATAELTNSLMGAEANGTWAPAAGRPLHLDLLGGFRWLRLHETYTITTSSPFIPPFPQDIWNTTDEFDTFNNFYGAQLGVRARYDWRGFFASGSVKFAMGAMVQTVDINGSLVTNDFTNFGPTQTFPGGYFALPTNIGSYTRSVFAVVPEVGLNVGYQITSWASVFVGYTFLYTNNVVRPGNQISRTINPTQSVSYVGEPPVTLEGPAQPTFKFNSSDFWAQGINVGLSFRF